MIFGRTLALHLVAMATVLLINAALVAPQSRRRRDPYANTPPQRLEVNPSTPDYQLGDTVDLECRGVEHGANIIWTKVGGTGKLADNVHHFGHMLRIISFRPENAGVYRCETRDPPCASGQFQCNDGRCIDELQKCDQRLDCHNGEDEQNCHKREYLLSWIHYLRFRSYLAVSFQQYCFSI